MEMLNTKMNTRQENTYGVSGRNYIEDGKFEELFLWRSNLLCMATKPMMETGEKYQDMNLDEKQKDIKHYHIMCQTGKSKLG